MLIQHRKRKNALDLLRHILQAGEVEDFFLLDELDSDVAVGFDFCLWQAVAIPKKSVIVENTVVGQGKFTVCYISRK